MSEIDDSDLYLFSQHFEEEAFSGMLCRTFLTVVSEANFFFPPIVHWPIFCISRNKSVIWWTINMIFSILRHLHASSLT